jgi:hypothetical protein
MGGACCTYGTLEKCIHRFVRETARKETTSKNLGDEGMIKIKCLKDGGRVRTEFNYIRTRFSGGIFRKR